MTFENTIKKISAICASLILFVMALSFYLGAKGFVMDENGNIVLVNSAIAKEADVKEVATINEAGNKINISVDTPHFLGEKDAPVTMYEYSSFGCSHCADFHLFTLPQIKKEFIDTGKLKLVFVDFPLDKKSMQAAMLSYCIPAEGYFDFLNIIFKNQREWSWSSKNEKIFINYASLFDISSKVAKKCMKDDEIQNRILSNRQQGMDIFKIKGTPSFVLKYNEKIEVIQGAPSFDKFKAAIENIMSK